MWTRLVALYLCPPPNVLGKVIGTVYVEGRVLLHGATLRLGHSVFKNIIFSMMIGYLSVFSAFRCYVLYVIFYHIC